MVVEQGTLYDKDGKLYVSKLSKGNARIPILESDLICSCKRINHANEINTHTDLENNKEESSFYRQAETISNRGV